MFELNANQQTIIFALIGSASFGLSVNLLGRTMKLIDGATCMIFYLMPVSLFFGIAALYQLSSWSLDWWGVLLFVGIGVFNPLVALRASLESMRLLGTVVASTIAATAPIFAALGAVIFLGERLTLVITLGILGVMLGSMLLCSQKGMLKLRPNITWWFYFIPLITASIRGTVHVFNKYGFQFVAPMLGGFISVTVSLVIAVIIWKNKAHKPVLKDNLPGIGLSILSGIIYASGLLAVYTAINLGQVVIVTPIVFSYPLFGVLANALLFRDDFITRNRIIGMLMVLGSVILMVILSEAH